MNIHFKTLGCRLNEAETESWAQQFQADGHCIVNGIENADLIILNSCAVTHEAVRKSRRLIRKMRRENPMTKMVVSGCYASLNKEEVADQSGVDLVITNSDKKRLVELTKQELGIATITSPAAERGETALFSRGRHRAFVKVQDGCRYRCTYCIVTIARGQESSRPMPEIIDEIHVLESNGIKEVVLTGVHLGGYGNDLGINLVNLIKAILDHTSIPRIRLGSLEPWDLSDNFFELFDNPRLLPHLHLPLQSGSDLILRSMARRCTTADFTKIVSQARKVTTDFNITTDIIVGFPGENEKEWDKTLRYLERICFGHIHIFPFSPREGTKAASMPQQQTTPIKKHRSKQLHKLAESMKWKTFSQTIGKSVPILWESKPPLETSLPAKILGYTPNYIRVATFTEEPENLENRIQSGRIKSAASSGDHLLAELGGCPKID